MDNVIKILIVDDHNLIRQGLRMLLEDDPALNVVHCLGSGEEAIGFCRVNEVDVVLMDIVMQGMTGIEATRWLKEQNNNLKVILISTEVTKEFVSAGIQSGINGYLHKDVSANILKESIKTVFDGGKYFTDAVTALVFDDFYKKEVNATQKSTQLPHGLTKREFEVLEKVAEGLSNKEVADRLFVSLKTIETHKSHILSKLGLKNSNELIRYAIQNGIISLA